MMEMEMSDGKSYLDRPTSPVTSLLRAPQMGGRAGWDKIPSLNEKKKTMKAPLKLKTITTVKKLGKSGTSCHIWGYFAVL